MYLEFIFLAVLLLLDIFSVLPREEEEVSQGKEAGIGILGRKRWRMSYGEVHLDFQIKNSHCSKNVSSESGRLRKGREDDALESMVILSESQCA